MPADRTAVSCPFCGYSLANEPCATCEGEVLARPGGPPIRPGRGNFLLDLAHGFCAFFLATAQLLTRKEFRGKPGIAIVTNLLVVAALLVVGWYGFQDFSSWLTGEHWGWLDFLRSWSAAALALALAIITLALFGPLVIEVVTGPFLDPLADTTERLLGGPGMQPVHKTAWASVANGAGIFVQTLLLQVVVFIPCLLLSFCGVGLALAFGLGAFVNALLWFEIPFTRRGDNTRTRLAVLRHNWARALGFGLAIQIGLFIPLFNLFFLAPAAIVTASTLYLHLEKNPRTGRSNS